jgi:hypothetical protein
MPLSEHDSAVSASNGAATSTLKLSVLRTAGVLHRSTLIALLYTAVHTAVCQHVYTQIMLMRMKARKWWHKPRPAALDSAAQHRGLIQALGLRPPAPPKASHSFIDW